MRYFAFILLAIVSLALVLLPTACTKKKSGGGTGGAATEKTGAYNLAIPTVKFEWDAKAGDPAVSAELGGPGFTGEGWDTNLEFDAMGSDKAVKGGEMIRYLPDWPPTLRMGGQNWNTSLNYMIRDLCFPSLVAQHPNTLEFIPALCTHWKISDDRKTYSFRINPEAKWSDGTAVTSADYMASYKLWMDESILFPSNQQTYKKFTPTALSKYIIQIAVEKENWRNFLYASGMVILPAKDIGNLTGTEFLEKYQFAYTSFCGPYKVDMEDVIRGKSVTITRNPDWWAAKNPAYTGLYNVDRYKFVIVKDVNIAFEMAKKGELDYYVIPKAKWFVKDLPGEDWVQRGIILRTKFFTEAPIGTGGIAINMKRPPLDDVRMRKAIAHLYDRDTMIDKLFFKEYDKLSSYWQGSTYGNPNNKPIDYDPVAADDFLNEMGYTERNSDGYRFKDGRVLELDYMYRSKTSEPSLAIVQESFKTLGIKLNLKLLTPTAFWRNLQDKEYDLASMNWGAITTPNPETSWKGELADKKNNNNVTGFKDARVDALCDEYDKEYDLKRRQEIIKEIDGIVYKAHPYALGWYNPAQRLVVTNKFSWPEWGGGRTEDYDEIHYSWWVDPAKEAAMKEAMQDSSKKLEIPPMNNRFWMEKAKQSSKGSGS